MAKNKGSFYAVHKGREPGVYTTWGECKAQIDGFSAAKYQKFPTREQAASFVANGSASTADSEAGPSTSTASSSSARGATGDTVQGKTLASGELVDSTSEKKRESRKKERPDVVVYCDGACKGNGKSGSIAGIGVYWGPNDERNIYERCPGNQTNNRAELCAIARVLETTDFTKSKLIIRTDSKYSINCFDKWIHDWRQRDWRTKSGDPVKNAPLIRYVATLLEYRVRIGQPVQLEYVKGHSGDAGNDGADALANQGILLPKTEERNWAHLEAEYKRAYEEDVKKVEEERRKKAQKMPSLEITGSEQARSDLEEELEKSPARKVRKCGDEKECEVKDCKKLAGVTAGSTEPLRRRYSAGMEKPSAEDLEAFANLRDVDDEIVPTPPTTQASGFTSASGSKLGSRQFSVSANCEFSQEELLLYAEALEDHVELSD